MILNCSILCWYSIIFLLFACKRCFSFHNTTSISFFIMKYFLSRSLCFTSFFRSPFLLCSSIFIWILKVPLTQNNFKLLLSVFVEVSFKKTARAFFSISVSTFNIQFIIGFSLLMKRRLLLEAKRRIIPYLTALQGGANGQTLL